MVFIQVVTSDHFSFALSYIILAALGIVGAFITALFVKKAKNSAVEKTGFR